MEPLEPERNWDVASFMEDQEKKEIVVYLVERQFGDFKRLVVKY